MSFSTKFPFQQNKNAEVRRGRNETSLNKGNENKIISTNTNNKSRDTIDNIGIITNDDDPGSVALSVEAVADCFREGVIVFNFGQINVYPNGWPNYLSDIENIAQEEQKEFTSLTEVYSKYKTFLLYRNRKEKVMILPQNQYFQNIFRRLNRHKKIRNDTLHTNVGIRLEDVYKAIQRSRKELQIENISNKEIEPYIAESDFKCRDCSLKDSKKKINFSRKKLLIADKTSSSLQRLPQLPSSFSLEKILLVSPVNEGPFDFPVQVSEEQRNYGQAYSEQVVSTDRSNIYRNDRITYGFSPPTTGNSSVYSHATSHASLLPGSAQQAHGHPRTPPRYPNYSDYTDRLLSFSEGWPHSSPDPPRLSQVGFFFTKNGDLVRCFQCGIGLKDFSSDDDPLLEHVRHSGQCPVLLDVLGEDELATYKRHLQTTDPEYNRQRQWHERHNSSSGRSNHRHPEYETLIARISTFGNWPSQLMQRPEQLADAGLYYTGVEDHVRCFACDGGLRRWDPEDDPWTEHCRWFPACPYAIEQKGEQFIALVQASVENEGFEASGGIDDLPGAMEQLRLRDSEIEHIAAQHRDVCLEMGYKEDDLKEAVKEIRERGNETPSLEDIIDLIDVRRERKQNTGSASSKLNESPMEENQRLKSFVFCMSCGKNDINALFLPCTHHKLCMTCAEPIAVCPVCNRSIREKIRTYMV